MKQKIFALHGQPGRGADFEELKAELAVHSIELVPVDSWNESLINKIKNEKQAVVLGYSWGAYRVLKSFDVLKNRIHRVVLIAPYLRSENPVSGQVKMLVSLPVIGPILMKSYGRKNTDEFLKKTFSPQSPPPSRLIEEMRLNLKTHGRLWKNAVQAKYFMQQNPLGPAYADLQGLAFLGDADQSAPFATQREMLSGYVKIEKEVLKGQGHGILWTHARPIAERIAKLYE